MKPVLSQYDRQFDLVRQQAERIGTLELEREDVERRG